MQNVITNYSFKAKVGSILDLDQSLRASGAQQPIHLVSDVLSLYPVRVN
jgi:hypothetical protein